MIVNALCANDVVCGRLKQQFSIDFGQMDIDDFQVYIQYGIM